MGESLPPLTLLLILTISLGGGSFCHPHCYSSVVGLECRSLYYEILFHSPTPSALKHVLVTFLLHRFLTPLLSPTTKFSVSIQLLHHFYIHPLEAVRLVKDTWFRKAEFLHNRTLRGFSTKQQVDTAHLQRVPQILVHSYLLPAVIPHFQKSRSLVRSS